MECCRQSLNKPFQNNHTPFPKHHIQQLPVYLKYLQYPQKTGKCLPHFPFDCSAIRGQLLTYTCHERCLPFTLALDNLQLTGAYHSCSTSYGIRYQQCDSSSTTAIHTFSIWAVPYSQVSIQPTAAVTCKCCYTHCQTCLSMLTFIDKAYQCSPPLRTIHCTHSQNLLINTYLR